MCNMYKITTSYFEDSRTICTSKIQHSPNSAYPKTNNQQKFAPRISILFLREQKHDAEQGGWIAFPKARAGRPKNRGSNPDRDLSLLKNVRAVYGTYPASYSLGTGCSFLGRTMAKLWSTLLTPMYCGVKSVELCLSSACTYSFTTWIGILYLPNSQNKTKEGYGIRLHRLGDNISSGSIHCIQFGRVSVLLSVDTPGKSKTLERFVKGRVKYTVNGKEFPRCEFCSLIFRHTTIAL
jgi:hypothetical protein